MVFVGSQNLIQDLLTRQKEKNRLTMKQVSTNQDLI